MKNTEIQVELLDSMGNDDSIASAARVSFDKTADQYSPAQNDKLIKYLAKHKHYSPFNHVFLSFRIKAPLFVARQMVKHKFMPWNEVSRRYVDEEPEFYFPEKWRKKAENVKQGSSEEEVTKYVWHEFKESDSIPFEFMQGVDTPADIAVEDFCKHSLNLYNALLFAGTCPEQARMVLPQNMMTSWHWSGSLGAFASMLALRLDPHTQYESRLVAEKVYEIVKEKFPVSVEALLESYK